MHTCSSTARAGSFPWRALKVQKVILILKIGQIKFESNPLKAATALVRQFILSDEDIKQDPLKFVLGWGWDHTKWPEQGFPTAVRHPLLRSAVT
jgi:hypothetical protein